MLKQQFKKTQSSLSYLRKGCFVIFILSLNALSFAQTNLVPNPSFEYYSSCPIGQAELYKAFPWFKPTYNTPDYYNECSVSVYPSNLDVPLNWYGFQNARTGNAYAGFGAMYDGATYTSREYLEVKLLEPLKKGYRYEVEYYISFADSAIYAIDAIGAFLGDSLVKFEVNYYGLLNAIPQISNPKGNIQKDKLNWVRIGGVLKAEGGEQFLTIGNFLPTNENTIDTLQNFILPGSIQAYYYIDDVSVTCLNCDSVPPDNNIFIPDAFSPNGDGNNDKLFVRGNNIQELYFAVYDRWGEKVFETTDKNNGWDGTYKGSTLSNAVFVYYCKGKYTDGLEFKQKGDVTLVR